MRQASEPGERPSPACGLAHGGGLAAVAGLAVGRGRAGGAAYHLMPSRPGTNRRAEAQGRQVHTGTSSGLDTDTRLVNLLADHQFIRVEAELGKLPPRQAQFYRGILANRDNDLKKSIELLEPLVDEVARAVSHRREAAAQGARRGLPARRRLGQGRRSLPDTGDTARGQAQPRRAGRDRDAAEDVAAGEDHPPMTVDPCDPFEVR